MIIKQTDSVTGVVTLTTGAKIPNAQHEDKHVTSVMVRTTYTCDMFVKNVSYKKTKETKCECC